MKIFRSWLKVMGLLAVITICLGVIISSMAVWIPVYGVIHWYNFLEAFIQLMVGIGALAFLVMWLTREP